MYSLAQTREKLTELGEKRRNGELTTFAYNKQKERILQNALLSEENGDSHRYPTRRRFAVEKGEEKEKASYVAVVVDLDDFIDDRDTSEFTPNLSDSDLETIESSFSEREEHHFSREIVIDCSSLRKTGKPIQFPENFFKKVIQ